jgi:hypothetical protein
MTKIAATFAKVLLFAVVLFFLGPQLGSLDIDGDGIPDVPIVVMHGSNCQSVQAPKSDRQGRIFVVTASPCLRMVRTNLGLIKRGVVVYPPGSRLDSVPPLRC